MDVKKISTITLVALGLAYYGFNYYKQDNITDLETRIIGNWNCNFNSGINNGLATLNNNFEGNDYSSKIQVISYKDSEVKRYSFIEKGKYTVTDSLITTTSNSCDFSEIGDGKDDKVYQSLKSSCEIGSVNTYRVMSISYNKLSMTQGQGKFTCEK